MKKQLLLIILSLMPFMASADDSGKCGENVTYTFNEDSHTLTISGEGEMWNYIFTASPCGKAARI